MVASEDANEPYPAEALDRAASPTWKTRGGQSLTRQLTWNAGVIQGVVGKYSGRSRDESENEYWYKEVANLLTVLVMIE
jgi:hypothetical protein